MVEYSNTVFREPKSHEFTNPYRHTHIPNVTHFNVIECVCVFTSVCVFTGVLVCVGYFPVNVCVCVVSQRPCVCVCVVSLCVCVCVEGGWFSASGCGCMGVLCKRVGVGGRGVIISAELEVAAGVATVTGCMSCSATSHH